MSGSKPEHALRIARLKPDPVEVAHLDAFPDDIKRLIDALAADGISASNEVACIAWRRYSDDHAAGWLALYPADDQLRAALLRHLIVDG